MSINQIDFKHFKNDTDLNGLEIIIAKANGR